MNVIINVLGRSDVKNHNAVCPPRASGRLAEGELGHEKAKSDGDSYQTDTTSGITKSLKSVESA